MSRNQRESYVSKELILNTNNSDGQSGVAFFLFHCIF